MTPHYLFLPTQQVETEHETAICRNLRQSTASARFCQVLSGRGILPNSAKLCQILLGLLLELLRDRKLPQFMVICRFCYILPNLLNPAKFYYISYSLLTQPLTCIYRVFILINAFKALFKFTFVIIFTKLSWLLIY